VTPTAKQDDDESGDEPKNGEDLVQAALDNFQLCLQIISDFERVAPVKTDHQQLMLYLQIDCLLRLAELGKQATDYNAAASDFQKVIALCEAYPKNNEDTLTSAVFTLGKLLLDTSKFDESRRHFERALAMLREKLIFQLRAAGKHFEKSEVSTSELMVESIFDTEQIKVTKQDVRDIQSYIEEIEFNIKNKREIERAKEKKEENVQVTEAFSKVPNNAAEFKPITFKLKKRTEAETTGGVAK
jgi:tetratricopeptide (TPR) repeat protein